MWQDILALLIVAIAALALLRPAIALRPFRFGSSSCLEAEKGAMKPLPLSSSGCSGCALGAACSQGVKR